MRGTRREMESIVSGRLDGCAMAGKDRPTRENHY